MPKTPPKEVVSLLNDALTHELTAINQYFLHAEMCGNWGYTRLHDQIRKQAIGDMKHAEQLIDRVLYLGGVPNVQRLGAIAVGAAVPEILKNDLAHERQSVAELNAAIEKLRAAGDNGSRLILEAILSGEESHLDWLEAQLEQIDQMGLENFLSQQTA